MHREGDWNIHLVGNRRVCLLKNKTKEFLYMGSLHIVVFRPSWSTGHFFGMILEWRAARKRHLCLPRSTSPERNKQQRINLFVAGIPTLEHIHFTCREEGWSPSHLGFMCQPRWFRFRTIFCCYRLEIARSVCSFHHPLFFMFSYVLNCWTWCCLHILNLW